VYYFEEMTFEQQVRLLHETRILMGQHGASLTNLLWMQPGMTVVELQNEASPNLAYFKLAGHCTLNYYCVACANIGEEATNNSDIRVNADNLRALLQHATSDTVSR
jgi:capsular polysaccharide biosynthesis protein